MGIGAIAITTSQKKEQSGPPFAANAAYNGASVDPVTAQIVLGNDSGDPAAPAALINDREIVTEDALFNAWAVQLNAIQTGVITRLDGLSISVVGGAGTVPTITAQGTFPTITAISSGGGTTVSAVEGAGGTALLLAQSGAAGNATTRTRSGNQRLDIKAASTTGYIKFAAGNGVITDVMQINTATFQFQVGPTLVADNGADFQISGTSTSRLLISNIGAGTTNVDRDLDSGRLFINSAAATVALFNAAAANFRSGFIMRANCGNVAGITVQAFAGQTIRFGSLSTSAGGTLSSTDVGAYVTLILINQTTWATETFNGAWVLT